MVDLKKGQLNPGQINILEISKNIAADGKKLSVGWKDRVCPLILGCYDQGNCELELEKLRDACKEAGFTNTILLKDVPEQDPNKLYNWNEKFKLILLELNKNGYVVCPIYVVHPEINRGKGHGLIAEMVELIHDFEELREFCFILNYKDVRFIEHQDFIHPKNRQDIKSFEEAKKEVINHLEGHEGYIRYKMISAETQKLKTPKIIKKEKKVLK